MFLEFGIINNVEITVRNEKSHKIVKKIEIHNKATRNMVEGVMRFLLGSFTKTSLLDKAQYPEEIANKYIPKYVGFGVGGIKYDTNQYGEIVQLGTGEGSVVPQQNVNWNSYVPYSSKKLVNEISGSRTAIGGGTKSITDTFTDIKGKYITTGDRKNESEMDSVMFYCKVQPNTLQKLRTSDGKSFANGLMYISELGLFPSDDSSKDDLLSYVKLCNYKLTNSGVPEGDYTYQNVPCQYGFMKFIVPQDGFDEDGNFVPRGIQRGTLRLSGSNSNFRDFQDTSIEGSNASRGYLYEDTGEDIVSPSAESVPVGIIDYGYGFIRFFDSELQETSFNVSYVCNKNVMLKSNAICITESDSIIIRWVITFAAIGKDNVFKLKTRNENNQLETQDIIKVPNLVDSVVIPLEDTEPTDPNL